MECRINLYLKEHSLVVEEFSIPDFDERLTFDENTEIRSHLVKLQIWKFKMIYRDKIEAAERQFRIAVQFPSKMNHWDIENE